MMYPLVQELAVDGIPIVVTCRVLGFTPQAFHKWKANPISDRDWTDAHLVNAAHDVHRDDPTFGYRFICDELEAEYGITASENRVQRLACQDNAAMESFFALLQRNVLNQRRWHTREELRLAIVVWIERTYHRRRRQRRLGRLTPIEFEAVYAGAAAA